MNSYVYAENLYTILPNWYEGDRINQKEVHHVFNGRMASYMVDRLYSIYGISDVTPKRYAMINRELGMKRFLGNFDNVVEVTRKAHPNIVFEVRPHSHPSLRATAVEYVTYKWLFCSSGSNIMNAMFMKPNTTVCFWDTPTFDYPSITSLIGRHIYSIGFQTYGHKDDRTPFNYSEQIILKYINESLKVSKNGKFSFSPKTICR